MLGPLWSNVVAHEGIALIQLLSSFKKFMMKS
jgi:hypothetical protein